MTLDKQIIFMEELLSDDDHWSSKKAKSEYKQLLKWLKDYKRLLEMPKGDLISREALKKTFENLASDDYNEPIWYQKTVFETIDNAPTVETYTPEQVKELVDLNKKLSEERPQGEWIIESQETSFYKIDSFKCSGCGWKVTEKSRFCPYCGARMNYQS